LKCRPISKQVLPNFWHCSLFWRCYLRARFLPASFQAQSGIIQGGLFPIQISSTDAGLLCLLSLADRTVSLRTAMISRRPVKTHSRYQRDLAFTVHYRWFEFVPLEPRRFIIRHYVSFSTTANTVIDASLAIWRTELNFTALKPLKYGTASPRSLAGDQRCELSGSKLYGSSTVKFRIGAGEGFRPVIAITARNGVFHRASGRDGG